MFFTVGAWADGNGAAYEIVGRRKLDSRQVLPFFDEAGERWVGVLERARPSRAVRGAPRVGLEAVGFDFAGVDETADIETYGRALIESRTGARLDDARGTTIALPSFARSIGYLSELVLPLLVPVEPPRERSIAVGWDGEAHRVLFLPLASLHARLESEPGLPFGEELLTLTRALTEPARGEPLPETPGAVALVRRAGARVFSSDALASMVHGPVDPGAFRRLPDPEPDALRFAKLSRVEHAGRAFEVVTPSTGVSVALLPYVVADGVAHFVLWRELRAAAFERRARQPLYDLPVPARYVNATAYFVSPDEALLASTDPRALCERLAGRALGTSGVRVRSATALGPAAEPASSVSSELRHRVACELDADTVPALPDDALLVPAHELSRAIEDGSVKDPVVIAGLLALAPRLGVDPYARARRDSPERRRAFVGHMTAGSEVERRLRTYSSIEAEQLQAPTYARLMTLLQHEFGLRIVYPREEKDRAFFKAAYRVFMAADRGEDRALQGLHFSHDCFHFALGNFTAPAPDDFARWYASGEPAPPEVPAEGPAWEAYFTALKEAENEATFFSFWTLYAEHLPLARHVGKLTFFEAMRDLGYHDRASVWPLYYELVEHARLPDALASHPTVRERADIAALFEYMRGFRDYQTKDIRAAWRWAVKDPYRVYTARFGVYETDLARYLEGVHSFAARLARYPIGLNPLLASCADVRVDLALRVWDVIKALRLLRAGATERLEREAALAMAEEVFRELEACREALGALRARVQDAEVSPRNEDTHDEVRALGQRVERARQGLWDRVAASGRVPEATVAEERARELPR